MDPLDMYKVTPLSAMVGDDEEDTALLRQMSAEARCYLSGHEWCRGILEGYFGLGVGGVVAVFLFRIVPSRQDVDQFVWVVVGDVPPLYITTEDAPNPASALDGYIGAMEVWADAAVNMKSLEGLPPVSAAATPANGLALKRRLEFIDKRVLSEYTDDL